MGILTIPVKPSDIDVSNGLIGSSLGKSEKETIAQNIVVISKHHGDKWSGFTFSEYSDLCSHEVTEDERDVLDDFVRAGLLGRKRGVYFVVDDFIAALWKFVKRSPKGRETEPWA